MIENALSEFGLTGKEIKVYLATLSLGSGLVQDIAKKAGTYRTYTYDVLNTLRNKGLVSFHIKSRKQYFEACNPEKLVNILKERQAKLNQILPQLKMTYKIASQKPRITIYEGKEGIKTMLDDQLTCKGEILVYASLTEQLRLLFYYFPHHIQRRVKKNIFIKWVVERSKEALKLKKKDKEQLREIRFLPDKIKFPTATYIYDSKVAIISPQKEIIGVLIESVAVAKTQKIIFNLLWNAAES